MEIVPAFFWMLSGVVGALIITAVLMDFFPGLFAYRVWMMLAGALLGPIALILAFFSIVFLFLLALYQMFFPGEE